MIAESVGGYNSRRTHDMYALREQSRLNKPTCSICGAKLAYDRADERHPACEKHAKQTVKTSHPASKGSYKGAAKRRESMHQCPHLEKLRLKAGYSKYALGKAAGLTGKTIGRIEQGSHVRDETLQNLAAALMVRPEKLTGGSA